MADRANSARLKASADQIKNLRARLLDLGKRNRLISFKHSDRARNQIRVIDELPDVLYERLLDGKSFYFKSLPEAENDPKDEKKA